MSEGSHPQQFRYTIHVHVQYYYYTCMCVYHPFDCYHYVYRRKKLDEIKQRKLAELKAVGIPDKYCAEVSRRITAPPPSFTMSGLHWSVDTNWTCVRDSSYLCTMYMHHVIHTCTCTYYNNNIIVVYVWSCHALPLLFMVINYLRKVAVIAWPHLM